MRPLRIVFMGTPVFAVAVLQKIILEKKNVVGVVTAPDRPAGRGRNLRESAVKEYSKSQNLAILQPKNLKDEGFLMELKSLQANLQIVVAFRMLPEVVWNIPSYGTFNLHASLLPNYRGAAPINWAIINQESETGVTTFLIDEKIDTGSILLTRKVAITDRETMGSLHDTLKDLGASLVIETISQFEENNTNPVVQYQSNTLKKAPKLTKENTRIDWNQSVTAIDAFIRGLNPFPSAWSILYNNGGALTIKIYECDFEFEDHVHSIGTVIATKNNLMVAVRDGYLNILEMQIPGKKKMGIKSLLNGYSFTGNSKMM